MPRGVKSFLDNEQVETLKRLFPELGVSSMARRFKVDRYTIRRYADELGLVNLNNIFRKNRNKK